MKPLSLRLKGFKGIREGLLKLDDITIDFTTLADAQLVALSGGNGDGKTTLIDNMHPYLTMPSRAGADGLGAFSYYEHVALPENIKDFVFAHGGQVYRQELVIRLSGSRRKMESYLFVGLDDAWVPVQLDDGTISDGKVETYRRCIEAVVGNEETFFISQFAAQGRRQLAHYKNGEIKTLMADLLGAEPIRALGAKGAETAKLLKVALAQLRQEQASGEQDVGQVAAQLSSLGDTQSRIELRANDKQRLHGALQAARDTMTHLQVAQEAAAQNEARRAALRLERQACIDEGQSVIRDCDTQVVRDEARRQELARRVAARIGDAQARRQALRQEQGRLDVVIRQGVAVARARARLPLTERVAGLRAARVQTMNETMASLGQLLIDGRGIANTCASIEREAGAATLRAQELATRLGLTNEVPCAGSDLQGRCKLLTDAVEAKQLVPMVGRDLQGLQEDLRRTQAQGFDVKRDIERLMTELGATDVDGCNRALARAQRQQTRTAAQAKRRAMLAAREGEIAQAGARRAAVDAEVVQLLSSPDAETSEEVVERSEIEAALKALGARREALAVQYRAKVMAVDEAAAALPPAFDRPHLAAAEAAVQQAAFAVQQAEQDHVAAVRSHQAAIEAQQRLADARARLVDVRARVLYIERELATWSLFARCMSNDGLIALSIDDAGPALSQLANELLLTCYGPRFTVSIQTQIQNAKGELSEGFDIFVHDGNTGEAKSVKLMSGGERVWINEALTRAIALYLAQNSGHRYETLFSDESDGPLDPERKRMFMQMKREVLRLGGYEREYFISQTPELTAMADAEIPMAALVPATLLTGAGAVA